MSEIGPLTLAVCIKICPDTAQLAVDPDSRAPCLDGASLRVGTIDENALEEAVRLRETYGGRVVAVNPDIADHVEQHHPAEHPVMERQLVGSTEQPLPVVG